MLKKDKSLLESLTKKYGRNSILNELKSTKKITNLDMLLWGIQHIADNHNTTCYTENWEEEMQVAVGDNSVPLLADIKMLCEDLEIPANNIYSTFFGIDIEIPYAWYKKKANKPFKGYGFWKRRGAEPTI